MKNPANLGKGSRACDTEQGDSTEEIQGRQFYTSNPRHLRVLVFVVRRSMTREHVDTEAGASNGPELVAELRRRGLDLPCTRIPVYDRDGKEVKRGVYYTTASDRRKIRRFFAERSKRHAR
jgi:hypothetical protein